LSQYSFILIREKAEASKVIRKEVIVIHSPLCAVGKEEFFHVGVVQPTATGFE
jgi:hypothetical protein